jgi:hypothetical protein
MNDRPPMVIIGGQPFQRVVQCNMFGPGNKPSQYNSTDSLLAWIIQSRQPAPTFNPTVGWYTSLSTQTGYTQGQVEVGGTRAQALLLMPSLSYTLEVWRTIVGDTDNPELIVRYPVIVLPLTI